MDMTKLLKEAIDRLRQMPASVQDSAARALITQLEEEPEPADIAAIAEGRRAYERGETIPLDQWRHDMGLRNN
jgi:predicted transcriptional regulator